ncbi:unnamed protein product [Orchesella dallaii]|uniref:Uncharacterized protein n=1 Tax=Orchesella dallaii TaxID=48710 RepID=A0ABP1Q4J8_9HEXA
MSDKNKAQAQEEQEEKLHGDRSPSSLSMASGQSMKWDPTADFMEFSHGHVGQSTSQALEPSNQRSELNNAVLSEVPSMARQSSSEIKTVFVHGCLANSPDSDSSVSQTKTYTLPGRSTPNESRAASLSFPSSPIPVERRDIGINVSVKQSQDVGKKHRNFQQQCDIESLLTKTKDDLATMGAAGGQLIGRSVSNSSTDWEYDQKRSDWKTSGLTRSELEYRERKNNSSSTFENVSELKLCVKRQVDNGSENLREKSKRRVKGTNPHHDVVKEMREVDHKLRDILDRFRKDKDSGQSGVIDESSSSGVSKMCRNARDYAKTIEKYLHKDSSESASLEERMQIYLKKIRDQIQLVEKYNRALIEKQLKRSGSPKRRAERTHAKSHKNKNATERGYEHQKSRKDEKHEKTSYSTENPGTSKSSSDRFGAPRREYENIRNRAIENKGGARGNRSPDYLSSMENLDYQREIIDEIPVSVSYERWTWPSDRQISTSLSERPNTQPREMAFDRGIRRDGYNRKSKGYQALANANLHDENDRHHHGSRRTRDFCTSTAKPDTLDKEIQTVKSPIPLKPKKPVAFFVPLFCDDCHEPMETGNNQKGKCNRCQEKYKWFCEGKGKDDLFDVKGPQEIQECFKEAACSAGVVKRNELLNSKFERMTVADKLCEGLVTKGFDRNQAEGFLREKCQYRGEELDNMLAYFDRYRQKGYWAQQNPKRRPVISAQEMHERTARLRANDHVILERRRKEEEESRRATNRIMKRIYASHVRNQNIREEAKKDPFHRRR